MQIVSFLFTCLTVAHALPASYGGNSALTATETIETQKPLQTESEQYAIKSPADEEEEELEDAVHEELLKELEIDGEENPDASSVTNEKWVPMELKIGAPKARTSWFTWW